MLNFAHPWLLTLLALAPLVWWLLPAHRETRQSLVVPFLPRLEALLGQQAAQGASVARGSIWRLLVAACCWLCVVLALARPQLIEAPVTRQVPTRDLLLAVDLSGSMATKDFTNAQGQTVERLAAVKEVLDGFLARRQGDRVGLILFGSAPFVQAPFTEDLGVVRELLDEAQVRMAGPQTALGDAMGLAINVFAHSTMQDRVLIALTDGNDTNSLVPPAKAAQIASDQGIVIHTVAVGDPRAVGEDALDEETLKTVASTTGGLYSHATDRDQLQAIYARLDALETRQLDTLSHRPRRDVYWWPLAAGLGLSMAWFSIGLLRRGRLRHRPLVRTAAAAASLALVGAAASPLPVHIIRPGWLLAVLPAALLWWALRRRGDEARSWRGIIAPELLPHLLSGADRRVRFGPLTWLGLIWLLAIIAIASPTWKHEPAPFADDTAALAIVVRVSPSMETEDIQPSRSERAMQKVHDLLQARGNAKASLIAYAGSAHLVMPATSDTRIIDTFAQSLDPDIMPVTGDAAAAALALADRSLADAGGGSILWIADGVAPEQATALAQWRKGSRTTLRLWPPLAPGAELNALVAAARPAGVSLVRLAADDSDVQAVASAAKFADTYGDATDSRWAELGYWLTPLIALLLLSFFRRGWLVPLGAAG